MAVYGRAARERAQDKTASQEETFVRNGWDDVLVKEDERLEKYFYGDGEYTKPKVNEKHHADMKKKIEGFTKKYEEANKVDAIGDVDKQSLHKMNHKDKLLRMAGLLSDNNDKRWKKIFKISVKSKVKELRQGITKALNIYLKCDDEKAKPTMEEVQEDPNCKPKKRFGRKNITCTMIDKKKWIDDAGNCTFGVDDAYPDAIIGQQDFSDEEKNDMIDTSLFEYLKGEYAFDGNYLKDLNYKGKEYDVAEIANDQTSGGRRRRRRRKSRKKRRKSRKKRRKSRKKRRKSRRRRR